MFCCITALIHQLLLRREPIHITFTKIMFIYDIFCKINIRLKEKMEIEDMYHLYIYIGGKL